MEPQETIYCYDNKGDKNKNKKNCFSIITIILLAAFTLVIGIIIGAAVSAAILGAIAAVIVLAVILGLLLILSIILYFCNKNKKGKNSKCCS